ncbi:SGNH/GDSL hydrolase family protein [Mucilaginibacter sp.]|jgi:lysophospholipase L1-like esterase|uniref:SGNH/GDSL hydrolase family protein n=1 Tax=Mucilaginibacter sp. TaxID=1882438 RepID=UPI0035613415
MNRFLISAIIALTVLASCKKTSSVKSDPEKVKFSNVLILGNSITYSPANPTVGWACNCGMAASMPDSDYVHLLTRNFKESNSNSTVAVKNIAAFELEFTTYDFDAELKALRDAKPDLIVIRIGENVQKDKFDAATFEKRYAALLTYLKTGNENVQILAVGSFWGNGPVDAIMLKHSAFIALQPLGLNMSNYAWGLFADHGVQSHPDDKGMRNISNAIWAKVKTM